jgi:branched-chain amino acid transport system substrate-binding protein
VRTRRLLCTVAAITLASLPAGCGGIGASDATVSAGRRLVIYSSLPLTGVSAAVSSQILAGERLALADARGHAGRFPIQLVSLDDSNPQTGLWDPSVTLANARLAARNPATIAYLGDYDSGATAISLPVTNSVGILQVSPASPYVGLTSSLDAGQDEPERFYPSSLRTFGRIAPGDVVQAGALVALLRSLGLRSLYVLSDQDPFQAPLAQLLAADAERASMAVRGQDTLEVPRVPASFAGEVAKVQQANPQAIFFSGVSSAGAAGLFVHLHTALPHATLLGSSSLGQPPFPSELQGAAAATLLATPALSAGAYPPSAQALLRRSARLLHSTPDTYLLYGYETMSVVLAAVRSAGADGDERSRVIARFFATRGRRSVLGDYSISSSGESSLSEYGIERVQHGVPVFWRTLSG